MLPVRDELLCLVYMNVFLNVNQRNVGHVETEFKRFKLKAFSFKCLLLFVWFLLFQRDALDISSISN